MTMLSRCFVSFVLAWLGLAALPAQAQNAANGKALYNTRFGSQNQGCYSCHGLQGSTLNNVNKIANGANNPQLIQSAINNDTGGMGFLKPYLNSSQITDIAAYLGNPGLVGVGTPTATAAPTTLSFAATSVGSTSAAQTVTLSNGGSASLSIASIASSNAAFVVTGGTCAAGGSVAVGSSCTVSMAFRPGAAGAASGSLTFTHNASPTSTTVALSGSGVALTPAGAVSPASLSFTQVVGSTSAAQTVTVSNSGTAALVLSSLSFSGAQASEFAIGAGSTCAAGTSVAPGSSCSVSISFTPAATGSRTATLAIANNGSATLSVSLAGTGSSVPVPVIALNQNALTFTSQALGSSSVVQTVTVSNTGAAALQLSSITLGGTNAGDFALAGNCAAGASIAAGGSCSLGVSFAPTALGTRTASFTIGSNASNGSASIGLTGSAVAAPAPAVTLSPSLIDFGSVTVGSSVSRAVTLTNSGTASLGLSGVSASGSGFSVTSNCGASVAAGASCTLTVSFAPPGTATSSGALTISSNATGSPHQLSLSGTGSAAPLPVLAWSGSTASSFVDTALGNTSAALSFTLLNQGPGSATLSTVSVQGANAGNFVPGGTCAANTVLASGASCAVTVVFAPSQIGARSAQLDVGSNGTNPPPIVLSGNGVATAQATLSLSVPSVTFPVVAVGGSAAPMPVTLSNAGTASLTITAIGFSSAALSAQPAPQGGCAALPFTLAPGQQCAIEIVLAPSVPGDINDTMTVASNATTPTPSLAVRASITGSGSTAGGGAMSNVGAGGCSIGRPDAGFDPLLLALAAGAAVVLWRRRTPHSNPETSDDLDR